MDILLQRFSCGVESTLGILFIDKKFECYVIEDIFREEKVYGKTRIPAGEYKVSIKTGTPMGIKYDQKNGVWHNGMLWIEKVPKFENVYIHSGNTSDHTEGCLIIGDSANNNICKQGFVGESRVCYERLYKKVKPFADTGRLTIKILDEEKIIG